MTEIELRKMLQWAEGKIAEGKEPPWAWYRYMQLREALEHILISHTEPAPRHAVHEKPTLSVVTTESGEVFNIKLPI